MPYDAIVIGAGSAGLSSASYLAKHKIRTLLLDGNWEDNQLHGRGALPHFPCEVGKSAFDIFSVIKKHFEEAQGVFEKHDATKISTSSKSKLITTSSGDTFSSTAVIVATGSAPSNALFPSERKYLGRGLAYDLHSANISGIKNAIVVGKSVEAAEAAIYLSNIVAKTTFVVPANRIDVGEDRWHEMKRRKSSLEIMFSASLKEVRGSDKAEEATILSSGKEMNFPADAVFLFTHDFKPRSEFLGQAVQLGNNGEIMVDDKLATSLSGIFAAGDVICGKPQMPLISAAQGLIAAQSVEKFLMEG